MHAQASKTVIVVGPQAKPYRAIEATVKLAEATKYATAVLPNAKVCAYILPWILQSSTAKSLLFNAPCFMPPGHSVQI